MKGYFRQYCLIVLLEILAVTLLPTGSIFGDVLSAKTEAFQAIVQRADLEQINFESEVVPILEKHCVSCHDAEGDEGGLDIDSFILNSQQNNFPEVWEKAAQYVRGDLMPPSKVKHRMSQEERLLIVGWGRQIGRIWDIGKMPVKLGENPVRRLNNYEYNYTIRDLFGIVGQPSKGFPSDSTGNMGFENTASALFLSDLLMENYIISARRISKLIFDRPEYRSVFLRNAPNSVKGAEQLLNYWLPRIYRRKVEPVELEKLLSVYKYGRYQSQSHQQALQPVLLAMLVSPKFIYRTEYESDESKKGVVGFELANRLSYFLWSSMPDQELFDLAAKGELRQDNTLKQQVVRMLKDPKTEALAMHFAGRWLGWEQLRSHPNPNQRLFPEFSFRLRVDLYKESRLFFEYLVRENKSAYQLLDSDFTFLNESLASLYQIEGVKGVEMRMVKLTDRNRGGVLGMGSVLVSTSTPNRTSPSVRGAFVLERLIGELPLSPPMDVETLAIEGESGLSEPESLKQALLSHQQNADCRSCHQQIDPIGFGLENFDAIGRWRTHQQGKEIDSSGHLPDGSKFSSLVELKKLLVQRKELFVRTFVEHLMSHALGRELTRYDRPSVYRITQRALANNCGMHEVILDVVSSKPFLGLP